MSRSSKRPEFKYWLPAGVLSLTVWFMCFPVQAGAQPARLPLHHPAVQPGDLIIRAAAGDTLTGLADRELVPPYDWRSLARFNRIQTPDRLPVGRTVLIPAAWRKPVPVKATVISVEGPVKTGGEDLKPGSMLSESDVIQTGANAVVMLKLPDGTLVRIPPASQVRIERLRGYHGSEAINARISLDRGNIELRSESSRTGKPPASGREVQIQTPKATASVRGTMFRVASKPDQAVVEVLDGAVDVGGARESRMLPAGIGASVDAQGNLGGSEKLLAGSTGLVSAMKIEEIESEVEFQPVSGARRYLVEVARDREFASLISQMTQDGNKALVRSEQDGPLYLKVRALSAGGIAGYDAQFALTVAARPVFPKVSASEPTGVNFTKETSLRWNPVDEALRYRLQVASDPAFKQILMDELLTQPAGRFALKSDLSDVTVYYWRVASLDQTRQGPWAGVKSIEFAPAMGRVLPNVGQSNVRFDWSGQAGQRFEAQLSRDDQFQELVKSATVDGVSWRVDSLSSGQYKMRVRQVFSNGLKGPYSPVLSIEVPTLLLDGTGRPVLGGTGETIRSNR